MLFKALTKNPDVSNSGPKPKGENLTMYNEFIQFNEKYFNNISINGKNLSSIQFIKIKDFYKFYRLI